VATRKKKEDWVMQCGKEKGKGRLGDEVWQRERKKKDSFSFLFATLHQSVSLFLFLCHTSSLSLPFSLFFATLPHSVFFFISLCHTSSPSFPFRLGDEVSQRERKRKTW
jgi:hypothetical protein